MLTLLLPLLALLAAFFFGSLRFSAKEQARVALQARLDVCAVRLAVARERFYGRLAKANEGVNDSKLAIYALRAAMLIPGAGEAAVEGQEALLEINEALATAEDALVVEGAGVELANLRCSPTPYSRETALCVVSPPLATALKREKTFFSDVYGPLGHRRQEKALARIRCSTLSARTRTVIEVSGDASVRRFEGYKDAYLPNP